MSESNDPVQHAARFLWIFSVLPLIFTGVAVGVAPMTGGVQIRHFGGVIATTVICAIGFGVHKRSVLSAKLGMALFAAVTVAVLIASIAKGKPGGGLLVTVLCVWPVLKLRDALRAMGS